MLVFFVLPHNFEKKKGNATRCKYCLIEVSLSSKFLLISGESLQICSAECQFNKTITTRKLFDEINNFLKPRKYYTVGNCVGN